MAVVTVGKYQSLLYAVSEVMKKRVARQYTMVAEIAVSKAGVGYSIAVVSVVEPLIVENTCASNNAILKKLIHRTVPDLRMWFLIVHVARQN